MLGRRNRKVRRRRVGFGALGVLSFVLVALLVPALATAKLYKVNSIVDAAQAPGAGAECETETPGECTLRAAIQAANFESNADEIEFAGGTEGPFDGSIVSSEIVLSSSLPAITKPVKIFGGVCELSATIPKPCAGVRRASGTRALFQAEANDVTLKNIAIGGGPTGVEATFENFVAEGLWLGQDLGGSARPFSEADIALGPGSGGAVIGSDGFDATPMDGGPRNVIAFAPIGVLVSGSSDDKIEGNYIGVEARGERVANVNQPVIITDIATYKSENDVVGGTLSTAQAASLACDGPCNVIGTHGGGIGIALHGNIAGIQQAATGPTTIAGNYVGLSADGTAAVAEDNSEFPILAVPLEAGHPGPKDVTVGGASPDDANYIEGGFESIRAKSAEGLAIEGNGIGVAADGSESESPQEAAIDVLNTGVSQTTQIADNQIEVGFDPVGIEVLDGNSDIVENSIERSFIGIKTEETGTGTGNLIEGNTIDQADTRGIQINDDDNEVLGNTITDGNKYGIQIASGEHNRIGGDGPGEANTVTGTGSGTEGGAIVLEGAPGSRNEVAANTGSGNSNAFITLANPTEPAPPTVATAVRTGASGTAEPEATVRVFSKASAEAGELGALLKVVKANASGAWEATFAAQPVGTLIAATQTIEAETPDAGTSEVSTPRAASVTPQEEQEQREREAREQREREEREHAASGGGGGGGGSTPPAGTPPATSSPPKPVSPIVKITKGPKKSSTATTAKFSFKATNVSGASFECKLDKAKWAKCTSPKTYKKLKVGKHTFQVRAKAAGVTGAPAKFQFTVKP